MHCDCPGIFCFDFGFSSSGWPLHPFVFCSFVDSFYRFFSGVPKNFQNIFPICSKAVSKIRCTLDFSLSVVTLTVQIRVQV